MNNFKETNNLPSIPDATISRRGILGAAAVASIAALTPKPAFGEDEAAGFESVNADFPAESWRYQDGLPIQAEETDAGIAPLADYVKWGKNDAGEWVNSVGDPIPGALLRGVDVSEWQRIVDWPAVKADNVDFAILRAAAWAGTDSKGNEGYDSRWERNASECERLGIPYGAYIYSYATSIQDANDEADYLLKLVRGHNPTYPLYIDLEDSRIANADLNAIAAAFCTRIEAAGYQAGVYASLSWWEKKLTSSTLSSWSRWVAQYNITCDYAGHKDMWQASSKATVSGIGGGVDINFDFVGLDGTFGSQTTWKRVYGARHLETMQAVASQGWTSCETVVVATNASFHDALAASALAGACGCPVLITNPWSLAEQTASEVRRLGAKKAYVIGGSAAINSVVDSQLQSCGCSSVERVSGSNGQDTAVKIARKVKSIGTISSTCIIATAETFQDALSISPYSYWAKAPIFLCNFGSNRLSEATLAAIKELGFTNAAIVGGPAAVNSAVESQLNGVGITGVARLFGSHCYETSAAIADWSIAQGMNCSTMGVATGLEHYDALCGGALCAKAGSPLVLVSDSNRICLSSFIPKHKGEVQTGYVFGGPAAVSVQSWNRLLRNYFY